MGDIADEMVGRMIEEGYLQPRAYLWLHAPDKRIRPSHSINCKATTVPILDMKVEEPKATPTHIVCSYCQKGGLHWGLDKGKPRLREEGGWIHDCPQVEGVSLSLPDVRTKR